MKKVAFKIAFSPKIGSGHLYRCSRLSANLKKRGIITYFIVNRKLDNYKDILKNSNSEPNNKIKIDKSSFIKAISTVLIADFTMSLDNVLGVAGAAKDHYGLLVFGLILSIVLMATAATLISGWIKKYKWIGWVGLLAILVVAIDLIYTDLKILII